MKSIHCRVFRVEVTVTRILASVVNVIKQRVPHPEGKALEAIESHKCLYSNKFTYLHLSLHINRSY